MTEERVSYAGEIPDDVEYLALRDGSGHEARVSAERIYIEAMGADLCGGMFVSQLVFWSGKGQRKDGWFYRTYEEWREKDYLNEYQVRKYTKACVALGWLETKVMKAWGAPTVHYRIKQREFMVWLRSARNEGFLRNERNRPLPPDPLVSKDGSCEMKESIPSNERNDPLVSQDHIHTPHHTPKQTPQHEPSSADAGSPVRSPSADEDFKIVIATMEKVGIGLTGYNSEEYGSMLDEHGVHAVVSGILAAAENSKQHKLKYVRACIENAATGREPPIKGQGGGQHGYNLDAYLDEQQGQRKRYAVA
jgi:hypothetical protein